MRCLPRESGRRHPAGDQPSIDPANQLRTRLAGHDARGDPDDAGERFEDALTTDLTRWPFQRARIQLAWAVAQTSPAGG
jgi:hypothetical protein